MSRFPETRDEWRARHARRGDEQMGLLRASGLAFTLRESPQGLVGAAVLFREIGRPRVDFYPSTGTWRIAGAKNGKLMRGGARAFLSWYAKQPPPTPATVSRASLDERAGRGRA